MWFGEIHLPAPSTMPKRSASPSVARPTCALFARRPSASGARFSRRHPAPVPSNRTSRSARMVVRAECRARPARVEIPGAAAVQRVVNDAPSRRSVSARITSNRTSSPRRVEIGRAPDRSVSNCARSCGRREGRARRVSRLADELRAARASISSRHLGQRRAAVGPENFRP